MRSPLALGALLAAFLALHALYNLSIPLGEGPDEPGHLAYVFFLAREGRLPVQRADPDNSDVPGEGHQPPLAYLLAAPAALSLPAAERQLTMSANPRFLWAGGDEPAAFRRGSRERWPWQGIAPAWHLARAISGLSGATALLLTYLAALRLRPADHAFALLAAALLALNPQFLFASALVTNDALLAALCAAVLWLALGSQGTGEPGNTGTKEQGNKGTGEPGNRGTQEHRNTGTQEPGNRPDKEQRNKGTGEPGNRAGQPGDRAGGQADGQADGWATGQADDRTGGRLERSHAYRSFGLLGLIFGLALLTKQSALLLGPLLLWASWRAGAGELRRSVSYCLAWGLPTLLVAGWWFARNWRLYGDPLGLAVFSAEFATQPFAWHEPAAWAQALAQLFSSYWARFGWMSLRPPGWTIWLYAGLCAIALAGWLVGRRQGDVWRIVAAAWTGPLILLVMALLWTLGFAFTAGLVAWQGRLLFPAAAAVALLLAEGLRRLGAFAFAAPPAQRWPVYLLPWALGVCALYMPLAVIAPAYDWDVLRPTEAQAQLGTPTYARYAQSWERGVELRGWRIDAAPEPGAALPVTLTWHSLEPVPRSWTVFVHLVDQTGAIVAESNSRPRDGALPFPNWTPGDWVDDRHSLPLPAGLNPGPYRLRVGLYRADKNGMRQGVWGRDGELIGDLAEVGEIVVRAPTATQDAQPRSNRFALAPRPVVNPRRHYEGEPYGLVA